MKKLTIFLLVPLLILSASWGFTGHKTIGQIAFQHLSPKAKASVQALLGNESLADAATWADEVRNDPEYKNTASWHFINVPLGLSFEQFQQQVTSGDKMNVYTALLDEEKQLTDPSTTRDQKVAALKFIAHFVGDMHQPMHVSRAEDKGGNMIQLNYEGQGTNLHALWDTKLLEHGGSNYQQLAEKYDHPSEAEIKEWQAKPPIIWAWESYQISSKLYEEIDGMKSRSIDNNYYESHIGIVERRITQAGIRLAGVLNALFEHGPVPPAATTSGPTGQQSNIAAAPVIEISDAGNHIGQTVKVTAKAYSSRDMGSFTLVNLGASYPNQLLTLVLRGDAKRKGQDIDGKMVTVTGKVIDYKGKPEIEVRDPSQLSVQ
ncbi:MAG: S1/P1 nuclease [Bacteroidetes bacterium]|nr:S1/P1 nuclease [Bacteroidota bacterium]